MTPMRDRPGASDGASVPRFVDDDDRPRDRLQQRALGRVEAPIRSTDATLATMTAKGLASRPLRRRSSATARSLRASQMR